MSKDAINQYDATAANNTDVGGISIDEGMLPSNVNNALREIMSHLKDVDAGTSSLTSPVISGDLTVDTNTLFVDASENAVGIGTSSPVRKLHVHESGSGANGYIHLTNANTGATTTDGFSILNSGANGRVTLMQRENEAMIFSTNATERMRIDSSGNLLVGTTSASGSGASSGKQVIQFAGATENGLYMDDTRTASGVSNAIIFGRGSTYVGKIETTTAPATNYISASDQRLKENIADADDAGSKIDAIQVRKYDWIGDGTHQDYGLVAQELQSIAPLAVSGDPNSDEMMGVDYSKLVPMLIKEIQSLRQRITTLENANG